MGEEKEDGEKEEESEEVGKDFQNIQISQITFFYSIKIRQIKNCEIIIINCHWMNFSSKRCRCAR